MKKYIYLLIIVSIPLLSISQTDTSKCFCCTEEYQQFDFWIGEWNVYSNDQLVGTNSIQPIQDHCILQENWIGAKGFTGSSINFYDRTTGLWNQVWIDQRGGVLKLKGGIYDHKMMLTGDPIERPDGNTFMHRITWTPNPDGSVRQHWETSNDKGETWATSFDGLYKQK